MKRPNKWLSLLVWLLPANGFKNSLLRRLGHDVAHSAKIGPNLVVGCGYFTIGERALISPFNIFRNMGSVELGAAAFIGQWNQFTASPAYQQFSDRVGVPRRRRVHHQPALLRRVRSDRVAPAVGGRRDPEHLPDARPRHRR